MVKKSLINMVMTRMPALISLPIILYEVEEAIDYIILIRPPSGEDRQLVFRAI